MSHALILLEPVHTRPGLFAATLDGRLLCKSRQPFFDAARVLAAEGVDAETTLEARHVRSSITAMRSTVGEAAKWTIRENERSGPQRVPYKPFPGVSVETKDALSTGSGEVDAPNPKTRP